MAWKCSIIPTKAERKKVDKFFAGSKKEKAEKLNDKREIEQLSVFEGQG